MTTDSFISLAWVRATDLSLENINVQVAAFVTATEYDAAKNSQWSFGGTYNGGGGFSFGGGNADSVFMSAWAVQRNASGGYEYISDEDEIRAAASDFAAAVENFVVSHASSASEVSFLDFDIEETYPSLAQIGNLPGLLATVQGQRFYGHALHALAKMCSGHGWRLNVDIQEPFLSLPFRGLDYSTKCSPACTTCAPWMPMTWDAKTQKSVKGGSPYFSCVTVLMLNDTDQVDDADKWRDANGNVINFMVDGSGPTTWTMMGYPLSGIYDVKHGAGPFGPYTTSGSIDVYAWMAAMFKAVPDPDVRVALPSRFIYATQEGIAADGHVSATDLKAAVEKLQGDGFPVAGVAYWSDFDGQEANDYLQTFKSM